jgi:hypothetical protein
MGVRAVHAGLQQVTRERCEARAFAGVSDAFDAVGEHGDHVKLVRSNSASLSLRALRAEPSADSNACSWQVTHDRGALLAAKPRPTLLP